MRKTILSLTTILLLCFACKKEHIAPVNQLVKDLFCFKVGSEWTYYDSVSQTTQKMVVLQYEELKSGYPKPYGKTHDWGTKIKINYSFIENFSVKISASVGEDNTAHFIGYYFYPHLRFSCDANNRFSCEVDYLSSYQVNDVIYTDVYVFKNEEVNYFVSKNIGLIQIVSEQNNFNWVLIDKKIQQ